MRRILVLRGGALGDFIVTLPALALLRRRWPDARIELAGNATAAALGVDAGVLDAAHAQHEARWAALYATEPVPTEFARWLDTFDLVVNFWPDPDGELRRKFPRRADQTFIHAEATPRIAPAAAHYRESLGALALGPGDDWLPLRGGAEERSPTPRIAIHPGSGSPRKNWPAERWLELARRLREELGAEVMFVLGEAEPAHWAARATSGADGFGFAVAPPLRELSDALARCTLFLGHDSGVSHLAAACGVPCVLLFGPTDPAMWAPPAQHVHVIRRGAALAAISVEDVRAAARRAWPAA
ncbi:MAG: hypothetical protein RLZZ15_86 [Verrucomicrobiota bacterium]|jgi:ADP-heptose:LPS heptosyltransferase